MKALPPEVTTELLAEWADRSSPDPAGWVLRDGAPEALVRAWPAYLRAMTTPDTLDDAGGWIAPDTR